LWRDRERVRERGRCGAAVKGGAGSGFGLLEILPDDFARVPEDVVS